jgi:hypothetical protein
MYLFQIFIQKTYDQFYILSGFELRVTMLCAGLT